MSFHHIRTHWPHPNPRSRLLEAITLIFAAIPHCCPALSEGHGRYLLAALDVSLALYGEAFRTKNLCKCSPYFTERVSPSFIRESTSWMAWQVRGCNCCGLHGDIFRSLEGLPQRAVHWLEDARAECAELRAWEYDASHPETEPKKMQGD